MRAFLIVGIAAVVVGVFAFLKPALIWKIMEQWKSYRAEEPSDSYILSVKVAGVWVVIVGIVMSIISFLPG